MPKKLPRHGKNTLPIVEIQNVSKEGLWIFIKDKEFFIPFAEYPWFNKATIEQIHDLQFLHGKHLYWPTLDIDIDVDALKYPYQYPLKYK